MFEFTGVLVGPDIRKLMKSSEFENHLTDDETIASKALKRVATEFLGKTRGEDYEDAVQEMLKSFEKIGTYVLGNSFHEQPYGHLFPNGFTKSASLSKQTTTCFC